ncbi:hypothetical protein D3C73_1622580 [compost metagenome]
MAEGKSERPPQVLLDFAKSRVQAVTDLLILEVPINRSRDFSNLLLRRNAAHDRKHLTG